MDEPNVTLLTGRKVVRLETDAAGKTVTEVVCETAQGEERWTGEPPPSGIRITTSPWSFSPGEAIDPGAIERAPRPATASSLRRQSSSVGLRA